MRPLLICFAAGMLIPGILGCNQGPEIVPVSGQVLIEGKPLQAGFIRVLPTNGRAALGTIGPDGKFTLKTKDKPGTLVGEHPVEISAFEFKDRRKIWYAPYNYADYQTSKLTAKVDGPTENLQINLVWDNETNRSKGMVVENIQAE
jgi:hypothetical protein